MRFAVVVGIPPEQTKRLKGSIERDHAKFNLGWSVKFVPARRRFPEIFDAQIETALSIAAGSLDSHVIGISKQDGSVRQRIAARFRPFFRFRWLKNDLLMYLGDRFEEFVGQLNEILLEEELWSHRVKPTDLRSPLLLPRQSFDSRHPYSELWDLSEQYGETGNVVGAARALEKFEIAHWNSTRPDGHRRGGRRWIDMSDRVFDHSGARHGVAPFPRNWKYSYRIEDGFHFDVSDRNGGGCMVLDHSGTKHFCSNRGHINIDPHGYVRAMT